MKWVLSVIGVVLTLIGAVWVLQGIDVIPVGMMAGQVQYAILGFIVAAAGVGLIAFANRRPQRAVAEKSSSKRDVGAL
jgi:hypothetical protein